MGDGVYGSVNVAAWSASESQKQQCKDGHTRRWGRTMVLWDGEKTWSRERVRVESIKEMNFVYVEEGEKKDVCNAKKRTVKIFFSESPEQLYA